MSQVLAGDIGGTRARFALVDLKSSSIVHQDVLESRAYGSFEAALDAFLERARAKKVKPSVKAATFGIAGPVVDQRVKATNLPWSIDARALAKQLDGAPVALLNDLVALGYGAMSASGKDLAFIHGGKPKRVGGNIAVIAAGTGLGEAAFIWNGHRHEPCSSEGGHADFGPKNAVEVALLQKLTVAHGHVSWERVASGSTIAMLYDFLVRDQHVKESRQNAATVARAPDPNVAVTELAESGRSEAAMQAIELWASLYGAEAGNLALKVLATGGVYVCGGVSARLSPVLAGGLAKRKKKQRASTFLEAFLDKGRMRQLLETVPVVVVLDPKAGLLGAAAHAQHAAGATSKK